MKLSRLALVAAVAWAIYAPNATAQERQTSAAAAAFDYYYFQDNAASPSDVPATAASGPMQAPVQAKIADHGCVAVVPEPCEPWRLFCPNPCGWNHYGWINGGIMANFHNPVDRFNGPVTFADRHDGQLNQIYWVSEKVANTGGYGWDWGGRMDLLYGTDYIFTQATGLELRDDGSPHWNHHRFYGLALPQLYGEVAYNDLSVKLGHFYTIIGYEVVPATGNFFYTHAYTMQYGEPFTHTGALATWAYSDTTNLIAGIVNGWDHFDREVDTGAGLLGLTWNGGGPFSFALSGIFSPNEPVLLGPDHGRLTNRNLISFVANYAFSDRLQYVYQSDVGWQHDANAFNQNVGSAEWYGINQYLFYTINECWKAGARFEWFRDDDGARVTGIRDGNIIQGESFAGNFFNIALGLNWTPTANIIVRPELRYDWFDGESLGGLNPYAGGERVDQWLAGFDVIFTF